MRSGRFQCFALGDRFFPQSMQTPLVTSYGSFSSDVVLLPALAAGCSPLYVNTPASLSDRPNRST